MPHPGPGRYGGFTPPRRVRRLQEDRCDGASGECEERAGANQADGLEEAHAFLLCKDHTHLAEEVPSRDSRYLSPNCRTHDRENVPSWRDWGRLPRQPCQPFTQSTCRSSATTSTRSLCCSMTFPMSL